MDALSRGGKVLFAGGSGLVGRAAARWFSERHPHVPILVGGRRIESANDVARDIPAAEASAIDLDKPRLGLDPETPLAAVAMLAPEAGTNGLRTATDLGVPYLNIGVGLTEIGPEMALVSQREGAAAIAIVSHWMGGAATHLTLDAASRFERVDAIRMGTLLDEEDPAGPGALEDMQRVHKDAKGNMAFVAGRRTMLREEEAKAPVVAIDGRALTGEAFSSFDIASVHAATGAPDVRFDIATGISSSRRAGAPIAMEIVVEIEGRRGGQAARSRSTLQFAGGQASLTGLSVALGLARLLGLEGGPAPAPGLYFPERLASSRWVLARLRENGAAIVAD